MISPEIFRFLYHSNAIEREYSDEAYADAINAWEYAYDQPFSVNMILDVHKILMGRLNPEIAGRFRNHDVEIGYVNKPFFHESKFKEDLTALISRMTSRGRSSCKSSSSYSESPSLIGKSSVDFNSSSSSQDLEKFCRDCHVEFEHIHPFADGNGRVGRILYNLHRIRLGLDVHIIYEGLDQLEYYEWFR